MSEIPNRQPEEDLPHIERISEDSAEYEVQKEVNRDFASNDDSFQYF